MSEEFNSYENPVNQDEFRSFISRLKEKDNNEIERIILHYIDYKAEMIEAALYVCVDKGIISYDIKERLSDQIRFNLSDKAKIAKQLRWEKDNAFSLLVAGYDDERIYGIIENPADIVIDAYHAILKTALGRELISADEFHECYKEATDNRMLTSQDYSGLNQEPITDDQVQVMIEQHWKCPSCNELVNIDLAICWKCGASIPEQPVSPSREEVIKEAREINSFRPVNTARLLIGSGILIIILSFFRGHSWIHFSHFRYVDLGIGIIFTLAGIGLFLYDIFSGDKRKI